MGNYFDMKNKHISRTGEININLVDVVKILKEAGNDLSFVADETIFPTDKETTGGFITLFHATNKFSANNMLKVGMGLNMNDYEQLAKNIAHRYGISDKVINRTFFNWTRGEDISRHEYQGGVSFLQKFESAKDIAVMYAEMGGEWKGLLINMLVKSHARDIGVSFNSKEIKDIYNNIKREFTGQLSNPVVVEVNVPKNIIVNQEDIDKDTELYTNQKVGPEYISKIHEI